MTDSRRIVGDCRDVLRQLIAEGVKVQMCVTSPPYFGLRDYGTGTWEGGDGSECEHVETLNLKRDQSGGVANGAHGTRGEQTASSSSVRQYRHTCAKCGARRVDKQIGLEALHDCLGWATGNRCCECHVCVIVDVFRLVREVLAEDGTCWVNYGDCYASSGDRVHGGFNGSSPEPQRVKGHNLGARMNLKGTGLKPKDLVGMPWRVALALQADGWTLRSDIIWAKPNPMPESCTDRPTKAHEYLFLFAKKSNYFYDAEAVREANSPTSCGNRRTFRTPEYTNGNSFHNSRKVEYDIKGNSGELSGRNRRTVWTIATESFSEAHFATFPRALITPCILAGTSQRGHCPECGARWVREVERKALETHGKRRPKQSGDASGMDAGQNWNSHGEYSGTLKTTTLGWRPSCVCNSGLKMSKHGYDPIPDIVLDPFGGSGTVGAVAELLGRKWILIDLNPEYEKMQQRRTAQTGMAL